MQQTKDPNVRLTTADGRRFTGRYGLDLLDDAIEAAFLDFPGCTVEVLEDDGDVEVWTEVHPRPLVAAA